MSFSREIKDEIGQNISKARHCRIAELAALFSVCGRITPVRGGHVILKFQTENLTVARKYFMLLKKTFDFSPEMKVRKNQFFVYITSNDQVTLVMKALKFMDEKGTMILGNHIVHKLLVQRSCCKRAFIRGMFLAAGSITDPSRGYHYEIVTSSEGKAKELQDMIAFFDLEAKVVERKNNYVVYIKEGAQIVDMLNVMEAHVSLMKLENVRIIKEMRNQVNRQVNCETANIKKTVSAARTQLDDIQYIKDNMGFGTLSKGLAEIAQVRLEHSEASLKELGELLVPPIGKSGVNHRLRKLSEIAAQLRQHKEENYDHKEY